MLTSNEEIKELIHALIKEIHNCDNFEDLFKIHLTHTTEDVTYFLEFIKYKSNKSKDHVMMNLGSLYKGDYNKNYNVEYLARIHDLKYFYKMLPAIDSMFNTCNEYITKNYVGG